MSASPHITLHKLHPAALLPHYAHSGPFGDLAADLHAISAATLLPGQTAALSTGLALILPPGFGALIEDRSGLALHGITTLAGVIDPGYRGEIKVVLTNLSAAPHAVEPGDRIAQLRIVQRIEANFTWAEPSEGDQAASTPRNTAGFGSTGT